MHIRANARYDLSPMTSHIVSTWSHFVPLFLMISGFGMFCGYYEEFKSGNVDFKSFYEKRYRKLLPFFVTLILIDVLVSRSMEHVIEGITEATLVFGLLPNNQLDVIGVSWTLGVIFLFYMLFPFFVFLFWTKKRAIFAFSGTIILSIFCSTYFCTDKIVIEGFAKRHNFLYCSSWLAAGCFVYLFRNTIKDYVQRFRWLFLTVCISASLCWYLLPSGNDTFVMLKNTVVFVLWLMYSISVKSKLLGNSVMKYLGGISFEMYLAQMVVFRALEKIDCLYLFGKGSVGFIAVFIIIILLLIVSIEIWKKSYKLIIQKIQRLRTSS